LIKVPPGLLASGEPYQPDIRRVYWLRPPLLDEDDPHDERPAVVVSLPKDGNGTITFVTRSTTERNGQFHERDPDHGLNQDGWFSRVRSRSASLWTPDVARSTELILDETTFSWILQDFGL
jgi:hypothetical protein